jgi:WD40 repeat protein
MSSKRSWSALSSSKVIKLWRYAVASDFHPFDPAVETDKRILEYGTEDRFLPFGQNVERPTLTYSLNSTGQLLAIANKLNIDIYDLDTGERIVLNVHGNEVRKIGFSPTDPKILVSWSGSIGRRQVAMRYASDCDGVIIWDIAQQQAAQRRPQNPIPIQEAANAGVEAVIARLGDTMTLSSDEANEMQGEFKSLIDRYDPRNQVPYISSINGSIGISSQSPLFSHSGEYLLYAPKHNTGGSAGNTFDICLYRFSDRTTTTLTGHRDSISWAAFSPNDSVIAGAGWGGDFRVYDLTGKEVCRWKTEGQIRAAIFSPDGKYLVSTNGQGMIKVWNVATGKEVSEYDNGPRGCKTLDWSPDGRYVIVGSESQGRLRLFTFNEGKIEMVQERKLSMEKSDFKSLGSNVQHLVGGFFGVRTAESLSPPDGRDSPTRVAYSVSTDEGVEVFDFDKGKAWRFVPAHNAEEPAATKAEDGGQAVLGHIWRKETGELGVIARDGIRFWRLD